MVGSEGGLEVGSVVGSAVAWGVESAELEVLALRMTLAQTLIVWAIIWDSTPIIKLITKAKAALDLQGVE